MRQRNQALVDAMEAHGYDVKDLAKKTGVTEATVYNWMRGGYPRAPQRAKLAELLSIDIDRSTNGVEIADEPEFAQDNHIRLEPAGTKPVTVRVSGDGLLLEVHVKHETAMKVFAVLGFAMGSASG